MGIVASFLWPDAFHGINQLQISEDTLESGNLFSGGWISASVPYKILLLPLHKKSYLLSCEL